MHYVSFKLSYIWQILMKFGKNFVRWEEDTPTLNLSLYKLSAKNVGRINSLDDSDIRDT
jgi:hypothetical protein